MHTQAAPLESLSLRAAFPRQMFTESGDNERERLVRKEINREKRPLIYEPPPDRVRERAFHLA